MFRIGDIVEPNEKAIARNPNEFHKGDRLIVTEVFVNEVAMAWNDDEVEDVKLARKGDNQAFYQLPINEITLVKRIEWS